MKYSAYITAGLGFGDEGKGSFVDFLCREHNAKIVVRFSGGPQAAHNVVTADGRHHTFAQFGSGTFAGAKTYLSRFMLVDPLALLNEHAILAPKLGRSALKDVYIEEGCSVITPYHVLAQRAKSGTKGRSCGMGIGEVRADELDHQQVITINDLAGWRDEQHYSELTQMRERKIQELRDAGIDPQPLIDESNFSMAYKFRRFAAKVNVVPNGSLRGLISGPVVFENAQGVLLDETHGSVPFNSWTDTTFRHANRLLEGLGMEPVRIGVVRTYFTRHGAGPFVTESDSVNHPEPHNGNGPWQGPFRQGHFDAPAVRYAIKCCGGIDRLAVTHCDRMDDGKFTYAEAKDSWLASRSVFAYEPIYHCVRKPLASVLHGLLGVEIGWLSSGPTSEHKERIAV